MRSSTSNYVSSFFMEYEPSINNQTIDEQRAGSLRAIRPTVGKSICKNNIIQHAEDAFRKVHDIYLDCILRQSRTAGNGNNYTWDNTSRMSGVAHGRQLPSDPLFVEKNIGLDKPMGSLLFEEIKTYFGQAGLQYMQNTEVWDMVVNPSNPALKALNSERTMYVWAEFEDGQRQGFGFDGDSDLTTMKPLENWD